MFVLKHIFRLRESTQHPPDAEGDMPLLDHLEDLRRTIIRMVITLLVSMLLCFGFSPALMQVLRQPVERVWQEHTANHLPAGISAQDWQQARHLIALQATLPPAAYQSLLAKNSEQVRTLAAALPLAQAASLLPAEAQPPFLAQHCPAPNQRELAAQLVQVPILFAPAQTDVRLMSAFHPGEAFMLSLHLAFFCGLICAFPLLLYFALRFIIPGLLEHERRLLYQSIAAGSILFLGGCAFAYFGLLPRVLSFFHSYSLGLGIANDWRIGYYLTFAAKLVFVTGAIFELPVILVPLIKLGVLHYDLMRRTRAYALVASFAVALFLAPAPDPGTMFLLALPLYLLYESCILLALLHKRALLRRTKNSD